MVPLEDPVEEAKRIVDTAQQQAITLRLLGGVSFYVRCPTARMGKLQRDYRDVDLVGRSNKSRDIKKLFLSLGYSPREKFNALQGKTRLIFNDLEHQRRVDIFLDVFEMCHRFVLKDRLDIDKYTIPLADMLATKLQVVQTSEKDMKDILSVLIDYPVVETKPHDSIEGIDGTYLAGLCAEDWGIYKTFSINFDKVSASLADFKLDEPQLDAVKTKIVKLREMIETHPKTLRWKLRAAVGEKTRWYELPEADKSVVDSRFTHG